MIICYFGIYDKDYCRNKNIIKGLKLNNVKVIEVNDKSSGLKKYWNLFKKHWKIRNDYDIMIIGFPGQVIVPFAKLITRKKIVFDAHVSLYDSLLYNWESFKKYSLKSFYYFFIDWLSCFLADKILLDTKEHVKYFVENFKIKKDKFIVVYHGADSDLFYPLSKDTESDKFIIEFHGYITRLHGIEFLLDAIKSIGDKNIELWIIGAGKLYKEMQEKANFLRLNNVIFYKPLAPKELLEKIKNADIGIGILGRTEKVDRVIPNKLYELMAIKIPVLSADTKAVKEHFVHKENICLCKKANSSSIRESIIKLKENKFLRRKISENAYQYINNNLIPKIIGKKLFQELKEIEHYN